MFIGAGDSRCVPLRGEFLALELKVEGGALRWAEVLSGVGCSPLELSAKYLPGARLVLS